MTFIGGDMTVDASKVFIRGYNYDSVNGTVEQDDRLSRAVRSRIDEDNFSNLESRIADFLTALGGNEHPDDSNLIVQAVTATLAEGVPAQFDAEYAPKRLGSFTVSEGHEEVVAYTFPNGEAIPTDYEPNYRVIRIPTFTLRFAHFYPQVGAPGQNTSNINTINNASYTLGFELPDGTTGTVLTANAGTLRYNAPSYAHSAHGGTSWWKKQFSLSWRPDGWTDQYRKPDGTFEVRDQYTRTAFPPIP